MKLFKSLKSEAIKLKGSLVVWICILSAGLIPFLFLVAYAIKPDEVLRRFGQDPWQVHLFNGWQSLSSFLFPMFIILVCAQVPQIEFRNNTWKQVFATPQKTGHIFFSKFAVIQLLIVFFYLLFNGFMMLDGVVIELIHPRFTFLQSPLPYKSLLLLNGKMFLSVLGISALQFWLSMRFKNFIVPVGIGLGLLIASLIAISSGFEHIAKIPFAHPFLSFQSMIKKPAGMLENHEWNSVGFATLFLFLGWYEFKNRKERN